VKGFEYADDIHQHLVPGGVFGIPDEPKAQLFFYFYWAMTALHGLHVIIGIGILSVMTWLASRNRFTPAYYNPLEISGLYWHFVDIVWIFLYPVLYLIGRHA
jgi:cytochrome c oxidase subunit 3